MISRYLIAALFTCSVLVSLTSGWIFHYDGVFPFPSWGIFSSFRRYETGNELELFGPGFDTCRIAECPFTWSQGPLVQHIRDNAQIIAGNPTKENPVVAALHGKLRAIHNGPIGFRIYSYDIDMKNLHREEDSRTLVFEMAEAK